MPLETLIPIDDAALDKYRGMQDHDILVETRVRVEHIMGKVDEVKVAVKENDRRITFLEGSRMKMIGIVIGIALAAGGAATGIMKIVGVI